MRMHFGNMAASLMLFASASLPAGAATNTGITPDSVHIQRCSACHYIQGRSAGPEFPNIAGQYDAYLKKALLQFKEHKRESDAMELITSLHKEQELVILADYYAHQKRDETPAIPSPDKSLKARGQQIYTEDRIYGIACADCHGADAMGYLRTSPRTSAIRAIPRLVGQQPAYLKKVLQKYSGGGMTQGMCTMRKAGKTLSQDDIQALVEYLASK